MDLQAWRQQQATGEEMLLPSGLTVRVRRASLLDLAERGGIPAPMVGMVNEILDKKTHRVELADFQKYAETINLVVAANIVTPALAAVSDESHLVVGELPMLDRLAVFNWACEVGEKLRPFRPGGA